MRESRYAIDGFFKERFSPTEFSDRPVDEGEVMALIEAASTAPSCYNEQPWRFILADKEVMLSLLVEQNREWAAAAPVLMLVCAKPTYARNGKPNPYAAFDSGTAWGYLGKEAHHRGMAVHAMAGFDADKADEVLGLGGLRPLAVIALGYTHQTHRMTSRKPLEEIIIQR